MERKTIQERTKQSIEVFKYIKGSTGEITKVEMAKLIGVARNTIYRWIKIYKKDN